MGGRAAHACRRSLVHSSRHSLIAVPPSAPLPPPPPARAGLFSATQTEAVESLARAGLRNPVRVNVAVTLARPAGGAKQGGGGGGEREQGAPEPAPDMVQRTPSTLRIQYAVGEATSKLPRLVAFLQVRGGWRCD